MLAKANSVELLTDPKIRLFAGGAAKVKTYPTESTGEGDDTEGAKECPPIKNCLMLCSGCHRERGRTSPMAFTSVRSTRKSHGWLTGGCSSAS